ncbi:MAG: gliding motility-associated C-terminal domain-containing protein [Ferruginibacter sp.]
MKNIFRLLPALFVCSLLCNRLSAQSFTPVPVTGFNQDVIAESGTSSLTTTTSALDAVPASNKVMYTAAFRTANGFGGGGIPDNGTITDAAGSYQLASYTASNALLLQRNQNADLTLTTPAKFTVIRILCFSTEGNSLVNAKFTFTDGSTTDALFNYTLNDWFNGFINVVSSGFGRCSRTTPASGADAYPSNPRFYYIELALNCADQQKNLQKINLANITTGGSNAPYPNAVFLAISGKPYSLNISSTINNTTCTTTGGATLTVTGSSAPYNIVWSSTPAQTGPTLSNVPPNNYMAVITDARLCVTNYPISIVVNPNTQTFTLPPPPSSICSGTSFRPNLVSNSTNYVWNPINGVSDPLIANPVLSPTTTTNYNITVTLGYCMVLAHYLVNVAPSPTMSVLDPLTICAGRSITPNITTTATSFAWTPTSGVSDPAILNPTFTPLNTTTYTIVGRLGNCSVSRSWLVNVIPGVTANAGPDFTILSGSSVTLQGAGTGSGIVWTPPTGLSATNILNPLANPTSTTTYTLRITNDNGCTATDDVKVTVIPYCIKPANAFTPNNDGFNDKWVVVNNGGGCTKRIEVVVFNRYGSKVYESSDYQNDWTGTYKDKPLPDGTYYYTIKYVLVNDSEVSMKGDLTILR